MVSNFPLISGFSRTFSRLWETCCILTFDPAKMPFYRMEVTHSDGSYVKKSRRRPWLTKWDKVKSHDTPIDWCTGREWPLNCMTVISAWWWSNIPVQRHRKWHIPAWLAMRIDIEWAIELLYNSVNRKSASWRSDELETRCGRESHHPAEGAFGTPDWVWRPVGNKMR